MIQLNSGFVLSGKSAGPAKEIKLDSGFIFADEPGEGSAVKLFADFDLESSQDIPEPRKLTYLEHQHRRHLKNWKPLRRDDSLSHFRSEMRLLPHAKPQDFMKKDPKTGRMVQIRRKHQPLHDPRGSEPIRWQTANWDRLKG